MINGLTLEQQYFTPRELKEALKILSRFGKEIKVIAGGTDLLVQYYDHLYEVAGWLDLRLIKALQEIEVVKDKMIIGAMVTHAQLEKSEDIKKYFPVLNRSAADIGSPQIRSRGTIGGNIVNASPAGDLLVPLMAYKAQFKLLSSQEEVLIDADAFFIAPKRTVLKPEQLLVQVILPLPSERTYGSWIKITKRRALAIATINLALVVRMSKDNQRIEEVRACLGSVAPTPVEIKEIQEKMIGRHWNQVNFEQIGRIVAEKIIPIDDIRGTRIYRQEVAKGIMISALEDISVRWREHQ